MLVLSRKQEQRIQIGEHVTVTILQVKGRSVRIGIDAPAELHIKRGELCDNDAGDAPPAADEQNVQIEPSLPDTTPPVVTASHRDRTAARHRTPSLARRPMTDTAGAGPLRRFVDRRHSDTDLSGPQSDRRRDEACSIVVPRRSASRLRPACQLADDAPRIDLPRDPYRDATMPRRSETLSLRDAERPTVEWAIRWRK
ncbi:MAG: carbon storage regulator [Planctomycetales bacterium]|nr:carbon storage regulator [Planctomycetales bacterium]